MVFLLGALAFSVIPGMQARVLATAVSAPTFGIALNASGFQIAAAASAWLGGEIVGGWGGLESLPLVGALITIVGGLIACASWAGQARRIC
jgi:DHA1 family inner membrane transport protein